MNNNQNQMVEKINSLLPPNNSKPSLYPQQSAALINKLRNELQQDDKLVKYE